LIHVLSNIFVLYFVGLLLEPLIGWFKFLFVYILTGLGGNILTLVFQPSSIGCGASGAILGLLGVLIMYVVRSHPAVDEKRGLVILYFISFAGFTLISGFFMIGVGNAAHWGGFLAGAALGLLVSPTQDVITEDTPSTRRRLTSRST
jgi:rhomboid protease GluP